MGVGRLDDGRFAGLIMRGLVTPVPTCEAGVRSRDGRSRVGCPCSSARAGSVWPGARANKRLWCGLVGYGGSPEEAGKFRAVAENPMPAPTPDGQTRLFSKASEGRARGEAVAHARPAPALGLPGEARERAYLWL